MISFQRPALPATDEIDRYLNRSRAEHWFSNGGPCWRLLRDRLGDRVGAYCLPVASGTAGLMTALAALGAGPGARALLPSFTFIATAQAAVWSGFKPLLADLDPESWHLDPEAVEEVVGSGAAEAVIAVSAFGTPPPPSLRERWEHSCRQAGIPLVVDSAAGFGAVAEDGVAVGAQGDIEVVSFHATKPFAIGEGGAVFTRDRQLHDRLEEIVNFGLRPDRTIGSPRGLNAKMSELHAATALAVLDRLDEILGQRRNTAGALRESASANCSWQRSCERSTWQFLPVALDSPEHRDRLRTACADRVEVRVYYEPLHELAPGRWESVDDLMRTTALHRRLLCLPMANELEPGEQSEIAARLSAA